VVVGINKDTAVDTATELALFSSKSFPVLTSGFLDLNFSSSMRAAISISFVPLGHVHVWVTDCEKLYSWSVLCTISAASRVHYPFSPSPCPVLHMYVYSCVHSRSIVYVLSRNSTSRVGWPFTPVCVCAVKSLLAEGESVQKFGC
jgi:hypothetical protein